MDIAIAAENVGMEFGDGALALANVNLQVGSGEFVSIVGPSGCGKSTLLRLTAGLLHPTSGRLTVGAGQRRRIAFVFQEPNLLPWRDVLGNVRLPLELDPPSHKHQKQAIEDALRLVNLWDDRRKFPRMLSGGMKMRASLARALVTEPDILLMDEPFAALDDLLREQLNEELLTIWRVRRTTTLFVTHNVVEAAFLGQRVLVMKPRPGEIVAEVPSTFPHPRAPELRSDPEFAKLTGLVSAELRRCAAG